MSSSVGTAALRVIPVTDAPWDDVRTVFGTRGDPSTCWCQFFKVDAAAWKAKDHAAAFERDLCEQVDQARASRTAGPGVLAYLGSDAEGWTPVGWAAIEPRPVYPRILASRVIPGTAETDHGDASVWAITCFVVRVGFRRRGVAGALLEGAVAEARRGGARAVEAYPVDTAGQKVSSADLYHGPLSAFEAAGFEITGRPVEGRAVVRRGV
ncbi:MAG: GNAT family N-acetyltransferase [Pseudolysinimonas sp.]